MQDNITDLIKLIKETTSSSHNSVWLPSLQKEVEFTPVTILQQRQILDTALTSDVNEINRIFAQILKINCRSVDVNVEDLTLIDKDAIILSLRQNINADIETDANIAVSISDILCQYRDITIPSCIIESNGVSIELSVPTIGSELRITNSITFDKEDKDSTARYILNSIVIDMLRCIHSFSYNNIIIKARDIPYEHLEEAINSLPAAAATQAYNYINTYKKDRANRLSIKGTDYTLDVNVRMLLNL